MDGIHDLGGKHGFGVVAPDDLSPGFAERWHGSVFAMINSLAASGVMRNTDHFRHAIERIDPVSYLEDGYYGRWLGAAETLLVEAGVLDQQQITERAMTLGAQGSERIAARPQAVVQRAQRAHQQQHPGSGSQPATAERVSSRQAKFSVGDRVRTTLTPVPGHTRLPAYARGRLGTVVAVHGCWVYPDSNAHHQGEAPQHLYTLCFDARTLWGAGADNLEVCLDLFEPYLHPVEGE
ncbi:MAG: nitrile hydratase subunit beta [bacterium]